MAFHRQGASNKAGVGKISSSLSLTVNTLKMVADTAIVTINPFTAEVLRTCDKPMYVD